MSGKRKINADQIVRDIRDRRSVSELMRRYRLSEKQIESVIKKLENMMPRSAQLYNRSWSVKASDAEDTTRRLQRYDVDLPLPVHDMEHPNINGMVLDISETGMKIQGVESRLHQQRTLVVTPKGLYGAPPIEFNARCRWVTRRGTEKQYIAGYEIIDISPKDLGSLRGLIRTINRGVGSNNTSVPVSHTEHAAAEGSVPVEKWKCPACGLPQLKEFEECPQCGIIVSKYIHRQRSTATEVRTLGRERRKAS